MKVPRRNYRDPEENYDHVYRAIPGEANVSRFINHPRKLVIHNTCANPYCSEPKEIPWTRTCFDEDLDD